MNFTSYFPYLEEHHAHRVVTAEEDSAPMDLLPSIPVQQRGNKFIGNRPKQLLSHTLLAHPQA